MGLQYMEHPLHTKIDIYATIPTFNNYNKNYAHRSTGSGYFNILSCVATLNNNTKIYPHRLTGNGTSHISRIEILGS